MTKKLSYFKDKGLTEPLSEIRFRRPMTGEEDLEETIYVFNSTDYDFSVTDLILPPNVETDLKKGEVIPAHEAKEVKLIWKANNDDKPLSEEFGVRGYYVMYPEGW